LVGTLKELFIDNQKDAFENLSLFRQKLNAMLTLLKTNKLGFIH
jgi:hypothetical protein